MCGILVPLPGIKLGTTGVEAQSLNHRTTGKTSQNELALLSSFSWKACLFIAGELRTYIKILSPQLNLSDIQFMASFLCLYNN